VPIVDRQARLKSIETRRSLLPPPAAPDDPSWERSWRYLFEAYTPAMENYVRGILTSVLRRRPDPELVQDIVQSYFATALEKGWLSRDDASIRCFRAYLQAQLRRFTYKRLEHRFAQKRTPTGTEPAEILDETAALGSSDGSDELDQSFVDVAVERALTGLREANEAYAEIVTDLLRTDGEGSPDLAERLDRPARQLPVMKHRATRRFALLLYEELRLTVRDEASFETLCERLEGYLP
jgi:DNA-directed RNA polymerase specialized sigma24 family protein